MNIPDFITMLGNISQTLYPVQRLVTGVAYLVGVLFFMTAIGKLREIGDKRAQSSSQEHMYVPMMYFLMGAALLYLPSALTVLANTAFGVGNVLTYTPSSNKLNIIDVMRLIIQTAGLLWFVRGSVLVAHSSAPGEQHGGKGLAFIIAGILAINFDNTMSMIGSVINYLISATMSIKASQGY